MFANRWSKAFAVIVVLVSSFSFYGSALAGGASNPPPVPVMSFADLEPVDGAWSKLLRDDNGTAMRINTSGLPAGQAFTVWWVVFNNPGECEGPCKESDLSNSAVEGAVGYATGHVIGANGVAKFSAYLSEGDSLPLLNELTKGAIPVGTLNDARTAEIHLIIRSHGPVIPGLVSEQISRYGGGCTEELLRGSVPAEEGECADSQFAIHLP